MADSKEPEPDRKDLMPGFRVALEARLLVEAQRAERRRPVRPRRVALGAGAAAVLALALLVAGNLTDRGSNVAYGRLQILDSPTVDVTRQLNRGLAVATMLGPNARLDKAHAIPFYGYTAYLVEGRSGWCLVAPDPSASDPQADHGVACLPKGQLERFGIAIRVGGHYLAAVPDDVRSPILKRGRRGRSTELRPNRLGVVTVRGLADGDVVTRYSKDGTSHVDRF